MGSLRSVAAAAVLSWQRLGAGARGTGRCLPAQGPAGRGLLVQAPPSRLSNVPPRRPRRRDRPKGVLRWGRGTPTGTASPAGGSPALGGGCKARGLLRTTRCMGLRGRTWTRSGSCWRSSPRPSSGEPTADKRPRLPRPASTWQAHGAPHLGPHSVRTAFGNRWSAAGTSGHVRRISMAGHRHFTATTWDAEAGLDRVRTPQPPPRKRVTHLLGREQVPAGVERAGVERDARGCMPELRLDRLDAGAPGDEHRLAQVCRRS